MSSITEHCRGTVLLVFLTALIKICFLTCCQTALQVRPDVRSQIFLDKLSFKRKFELSSLIGALSWVSLQSHAEVHGIWNSKTDLKIVSHNNLKDPLPGSMLFQLGLFTFVFPTFFPELPPMFLFTWRLHSQVAFYTRHEIRWMSISLLSWTLRIGIKSLSNNKLILDEQPDLKEQFGLMMSHGVATAVFPLHYKGNECNLWHLS